MKLLWICPTLNPTSGGTVAMIAQFTTELQKIGHTCEVVTLDSENVPGVAEFPGVVHALGPSLGNYGFNTRLVPWLRKNAKCYDIVIVSGIWQYPSFATWLASKKSHFQYFVFTHGMLDPWFRYSYPWKHLKKWLYWPWAEYLVLRDARAVLFTSMKEKQLASQSFWLYKVNELVVNYGIGSPQGNPDYQRRIFLNEFPGLQEKRLILFLGRIHPVKGCDLLINAFAQVAQSNPDLHLVMAGPDQEGWKFKLMQKATHLGIGNRITWTGMLSGDLKWGAYHAADVFILPSHSENFGVVVAEALACNLPVLITDKVNISQDIKEDNAGIVDLDTLEGTDNLLQKWLHLSENEQKEMRANARNCFLQRFEVKIAAENLIKAINPFIDINAEAIDIDP